VCKAWAIPCNEQKNIDRWQFRIRNFRRLVRGWAANEVAVMNKRKGELAVEYNLLDQEAEQSGLPAHESRPEST
jgi:hypothetical protein